jgi:hypothetical protein
MTVEGSKLKGKRQWRNNFCGFQIFVSCLAVLYSQGACRHNELRDYDNRPTSCQSAAAPHQCGCYFLHALAMVFR